MAKRLLWLGLTLLCCKAQSQGYFWPTSASARLANGTQLRIVGPAIEVIRKGIVIETIVAKQMYPWFRVESLPLWQYSMNEATTATLSRIEAKWFAQPYQLVPVGSEALVLVRWGWDKAHHFEHLLRVSVKPRFSVISVRPLKVLDSSFWAPEADRIYRLGGKILLVERGKIVEINSKGEEVRIRFEIPSGLYPKAKVGDWLVLAEEGLSGRQVKFFNLKSGAMRTALEPPADGILWREIRQIDPKKRLMLLQISRMNGKISEWYHLAIPSGKLKRVSASYKR